MKFRKLLQACLVPGESVRRDLTTPEDEVCHMAVHQVVVDKSLPIIVRDFAPGAYNGIKPSDLIRRADHLLLSAERILRHVKCFTDSEYKAIEILRYECRQKIRGAFGSIETLRDSYGVGRDDAVPDFKPFQTILDNLRDDIILLFLKPNVFPDYQTALARLQNTDQQLDIESSRPAWLHRFYLRNQQYINYHEPIGYLTDAQVKESLVPINPAPWDLHVVLDQRGVCTIPTSVRHLEGVANFVWATFSSVRYVDALQQKPLFVGSRSTSLTSLYVEDETARRAMAERMLFQVAKNIGDRLFKEGWMPSTKGFTIALHSLLTLTTHWAGGAIQHAERVLDRDPETPQILDIWEAVKAWARRKECITLNGEVVPVSIRLMTYGCNVGRNWVVGEEEAEINKVGYGLFINSVCDYVISQEQKSVAHDPEGVDDDRPPDAPDSQLVNIFRSLREDHSLENWLTQKTDLMLYIRELAEARLAQDDPIKRKRYNILSLFVQTQELFLEKGEKYKEDRYIFELHVRMILLENLIGESPHIFCKSGCDRTGVVDELIQTYLAFEDQVGRYPTLDEVDFDVEEVSSGSRKKTLLNMWFAVKQYSCAVYTAEANKIGGRALKLDVEHRDKYGRMLWKSEQPISKLVEKGWDVSAGAYNANIEAAEQRSDTRSYQMVERSAAIPTAVELLQTHISTLEFLPALLNLLVAKRKKESVSEQRAFGLLCAQGLEGDIVRPSLQEGYEQLSRLELACRDPHHYAVFKFMKGCVELYLNRNIDIDAPRDMFVELRKSQSHVPHASVIYLFASVFWGKFIFPPSVQTNGAICFVHRVPAIKNMLLLYYARLSDVLGGQHDKLIESLMAAWKNNDFQAILRLGAELDRIPTETAVVVVAPWSGRAKDCLREFCTNFKVDPEQILALAAKPVVVPSLAM